VDDSYYVRGRSRSLPEDLRVEEDGSGSEPLLDRDPE